MRIIKMSLNAISPSIKNGFVGLLAACVATGGVVFPQAAFGQNGTVHPLETFKQTETSNGAQNFLGNTPESQPPLVKRSAVAQKSYLVSPTQDELISNVFLAFLFFVLPAGVAFAIWKQEKRNRAQLLTLDARIEMLERIWKKSPQFPQH
jgi:hypothetical protein